MTQQVHWGRFCEAVERIATALEAMAPKRLQAANPRIPTWNEMHALTADLSVRARNCLYRAQEEGDSIEYLLAPRGAHKHGMTNLTRLRHCGRTTQAEILAAVERWRAEQL